MEIFLSVLLYVLTGIGVLMVISFWVSDIYLDGKRFRWYYYLPAAAVCMALGMLFPLFMGGWLYALVENIFLAVLLPAVYLLTVAGVLASGFFLFRKKDDFSGSFYFSLCLLSLVVLAGWLIRLFNGG